MTAIIQTERLDLVPMTPAFLHASLAGDACRAEELLSASLPMEWPGDYVNSLSRRLGQLEIDRSLQPWLLRAMVLRGSGVAVGHIGFHTAPGPDDLRQISPDAVEFGYTVYPTYRRQGYAREAAVALMRWATESHGVRSFVLSIRPDNIASQALAAKLGFRRIGSHLDEVDGVEDVLVFTVSKGGWDMGGGTSPQSQRAVRPTESDFSGLVVFGHRGDAFKCPPFAFACGQHVSPLCSSESHAKLLVRGVLRA